MRLAVVENGTSRQPTARIDGWKSVVINLEIFRFSDDHYCKHNLCHKCYFMKIDGYLLGLGRALLMSLSPSLSCSYCFYLFYFFGYFFLFCLCLLVFWLVFSGIYSEGRCCIRASLIHMCFFLEIMCLIFVFQITSNAQHQKTGKGMALFCYIWKSYGMSAWFDSIADYKTKKNVSELIQSQTDAFIILDDLGTHHTGGLWY